MNARKDIPGSGYYGGIGNCGPNCFDQLVKESHCTWLKKFKNYQDYRMRASDCEKAWAAQDYLGSDYIRNKGGLVSFGPSKKDNPEGWYGNSGVIPRFKKCANDLRRIPGRIYRDCVKYTGAPPPGDPGIFVPGNPGNPQIPASLIDTYCMEPLKEEKKCP